MCDADDDVLGDSGHNVHADAREQLFKVGSVLLFHGFCLETELGFQAGIDSKCIYLLSLSTVPIFPFISVAQMKLPLPLSTFPSGFCFSESLECQLLPSLPMEYWDYRHAPS